MPSGEARHVDAGISLAPSFLKPESVRMSSMDHTEMQEYFYMVVSPRGAWPEHRILEWLQEDYRHSTPGGGGLA